jgi:hypothetical protein
VEKLVWKLVAVLSGLVAAKASHAVLDKAWKSTHAGEEPPRNPASPGTTWAEAVTWAAASGFALAVGKLVATRGAASVWQKSTGHLPPGVDEVGN